MPGHKPIMVTLISNIYVGLRDLLFRAMLEPASHQKRKEKEAKKENKK